LITSAVPFGSVRAKAPIALWSARLSDEVLAKLSVTDFLPVTLPDGVVVPAEELTEKLKGNGAEDCGEYVSSPDFVAVTTQIPDVVELAKSPVKEQPFALPFEMTSTTLPVPEPPRVVTVYPVVGPPVISRITGDCGMSAFTGVETGAAV
jgi:hypothetical protein